MTDRSVGYGDFMTAKRILKKDKKEWITDAAITVFARKGIFDTRIADIANEAGIGKGTVYEYFKSKEEVIDASIERFMAEVFEKLGAEVFFISDPIKKIQIMIEKTVELFHKEMENKSFYVDIFRESLSSKKRNLIMRDMYKQYRGMIAEILNDGIKRGELREIDTAMTASYIIGALDGMVLQMVVDPELFNDMDDYSLFGSLFLEGIRK